MLDWILFLICALLSIIQACERHIALSLCSAILALSFLKYAIKWTKLRKEEKEVEKNA